MGCLIAKKDKTRRSTDRDISISSIVFVQKWFASRKQSLKSRMRYSWEIYESIRSTHEEDRQTLLHYYEALFQKHKISAMHSKSPAQILYDLSDIEVDQKIFQKYKGPRIQFPVSISLIESVIEFFNTKKHVVLHPTDACDILNKAIERLRNLPNINFATTGVGKRITVVGNLYGSWEDLVTIFFKNNLPSIMNPYIFNGDLVDIGSYGVEVLLLVLLCFLAYPHSVFLNRGCHEDPAMNRIHGFEDEIDKKYGRNAHDIYKRIKELYRWLPLATIINNKIFVVHGGISDRVSISTVHSISRSDFMSVKIPPHFVSSEHKFEWFQILDLLWSDPNNKFGCHRNETRGLGLTFGFDVTEKFLATHDLEYIIRSHECKREGFETCHFKKVVTIFSCSNFYASGSNKGCYVIIDSLKKTIPFSFWPMKSILRKISPKAKVNQFENFLAYVLCDRIISQLGKMKAAFIENDASSSGLIPLDGWCRILRNISGIDIPWQFLALTLNNEYKIDSNNFVVIDYHITLDKMKANNLNEIMISTFNLPECFYNNYAVLQILYQRIDVDGDGIITESEFNNSFKNLPTFKSKVSKTEMLNLFKCIDLNNDNIIDINEFFEAFRLVNSKQ